MIDQKMLNHKQSVENLIGLPETLLFSLYARKRETESNNGFFKDEKAVEIVSQLDYDFSRYCEGTQERHFGQLAIVMATRAIDDQVRQFIDQQPDSTVVYLGAGLDARYERVDNGRVLWYDLDLPPVIQVRRSFFPETDRYRLIAKSMFDMSWADKVLERKPMLFICEGTLLFFKEEEVRKLMVGLIKRFPGCELIFDSIPPMARRGLNTLTAAAGAPMTYEKTGSFPRTRWGLKKISSLRQWHRDIQIIDQVNLLRHYNSHPELPLFIKIISPILDLHGGRIIHLKLG